MNDLENKVRKEVEKNKKLLIEKAKKQGIYENFGQSECSKIEDKFDLDFYDLSKRRAYTILQNFEKWCMNFDLSMI